MAVPRSQRARIHGLYSDTISAAESAELAKIQETDIHAEIAYLRTVCSRLAKIVNANGVDEGSLEPPNEATIRTLHALDRKLNTLLRYIRTLAYLKGELNEYDRQIEEGEFLARKARNVFNYFSTGKKAQPRGGPGPLGDE